MQTRHHGSSLSITARGRPVAMPRHPTWPAPTIRDNCQAMLPLLLAERARRAMALADETGSYRYTPRQFGDAAAFACERERRTPTASGREKQ